MKILRITYLIFLLVILPWAVKGQVDTTTTDSTTTLDSLASDTLFLVKPELSLSADTVDTVSFDPINTDTLFRFPLALPTSQDTVTTAEEEAEEKPLFTVRPWDFRAPIGAQKTATDSTLRWQYWPDWTYKLNREPGVITYRMGTSNRSNAAQINAHEPRYQHLYWEDISLNDPVSGAVNWNLIPQTKIAAFYQEDEGIEHQSRYYNHQYYINEPLSRLIYSESKYNYRNLEFEVSHNLSQRTNVELTYWDRRAGGEYDNSEITGRQIYTKISHHLSENQYLKLNYMTNSLDIGRPFGYIMQDLRTFNFDRFSASPTQSTTSSEETTNILALNYYQRSQDSTQTTDNFRAGIFQNLNERFLDLPSDTTGYRVRSVGANARKWWRWGMINLETGLNTEYFINQTPEGRSLPADNWLTTKADGTVQLSVHPNIDLLASGKASIRSDGFQSYQINTEANVRLGKFAISAGASNGSVMPTPQQLYWDSQDYKGNHDLTNEEIQEVRGTLRYHLNDRTHIGIRGQVKDITDGIMMGDSLFTNIDSYASQSATAFFEWNLTHFEFDGSAIVHRFADSYTAPSGSVPMSPSERVWLKGGAYWKGYLFDRATYVKAGVSGMASPFRYKADHYNPVLNHWQPISDDQQLPMFNRLDVDISARVRSIMVTLRWENVLDDVSQLGYFESARYPMGQRRFILSIRALFRN